MRSIRCVMGLKMVCLAILTNSCGAWTAFADQDALPSVPGTSLRSDVELPILLGRADMCKIAATSLDKAYKVCRIGEEKTACPLICGASWSAALRDAYYVIGVVCPDLEARASLWEDYVSIADEFVRSEWDKIQSQCLAMCGNQWCTLSGSPNSVLNRTLAPPPSECTQFYTTDGMYRYPFLTWKSVEYYQHKGQGLTGGLAVAPGDEFTTWACVYQPFCTKYAEDDLACFKYNSVLGEFQFWGWNAKLQLAPRLFLLPASFCDTSGNSLLLNARPGLQHVSLSDATYSFSLVGDNGQVSLFKRGTMASLAPQGCGVLRLIPDTHFWLEVYAGQGFYSWKGLFKARGPERQGIALALYPIIPVCQDLGITLEWCAGDPVDIDLYLFTPAAERGAYVLDRAHALAWSRSVITQGAGAGNGGATLTLERDDQGEAYPGGPRTFGPESMYVEGMLMPGTYAVMTQVYSENPESTYRFGCTSVSLYSGSVQQGQVFSRMVDKKGTNGNWWHVFNIVVEYGDVSPAPGQTLADCPTCTLKYSYVIVDRIIDGPAVSMTGEFDSNPFTAVTALPPARYLFESAVAGPSWAPSCSPYVYVGMRWFDAVTGSELFHGSFKEVLQGGGYGPSMTFPQQGTLQLDLPYKFKGGVPLLFGHHSLLITCTGYSSYVLDMSLTTDQDIYFFAVYLVPADGQTRAVLRWGNAPQDLDLYVVPVGVRDPNNGGQEVGWSYLDGSLLATVEDGESPYLWWGVLPDDQAECQCVSVQLERCVPNCGMVSSGEAPAQLTLDNDGMKHGRVDDLEFILNSAEVVTFTSLLPGVYKVYINAYPPQVGAVSSDFDGDVFLDVWLGNGMTATLAETVRIAQTSAGQWMYTGYLQVTEGLSACNLWNQKLQIIGSTYCYSWFTVSQVVPYPLGYTASFVIITDAKQPGVNFENAHYVVSQGGSCSCTGSVECTCTNGVEVISGSVGPQLTDASSSLGYWTGEAPLYLIQGTYNVVIRMQGYNDRHVVIVVPGSRKDIHAVMVPLVSSGALDIVLTWGARPYDLDLWVARASNPLPDYTKAVFWGQTNNPYDASSGISVEMQGVGLDRDWKRGWGPETIHLDNSVAVQLSYRIAVNVYSDQQDNQQCVAGVDSGCNFRGGEKVEFYDSNGLLLQVLKQSGAGTWWIIGTVVKQSSGHFTINTSSLIEIGSCFDVFLESDGCPI